METIIDKDIKIDDLELIKQLDCLKSEFLPQIKKVYEEVKIILENRIPVIFPNYTLHNINHSLRIIKNMAQIVGELSKLGELEIVILVYSALLHDIGMGVSEDDLKKIKEDDFPLFDIKYSAFLKLHKHENLALQEYVRKFHSSLSAKYIKEHSESFVIPRLSQNFAGELALICESHTKDFDWIKTNLTLNEIKGDYKFNSQYIACVLRLADILDIDSNRTPYNLFQIINPKSISKDEWQQHFVISNNEKIKINEVTKRKVIYFHGSCDNPKIHRKLLNYIDWVKSELINSVNITNSMLPQYNLEYEVNPEIQIHTNGYTFSDYKMTLDYKAISALLMGEKIYGDKSLGLRELIQNSIDSCRIKEEDLNSKLEIGSERYVPKIKIILDEKNKTVRIRDNGTGMSLEVIKRHFLNIGVSYYNSTDFRLRDLQYKPIGNFGIGFLSCFMLSDNVIVNTRHYKSKYKYTIQLEKNNEYTSLTQAENVEFEGTEIVLNYDDFISQFKNDGNNVFIFVNKFFLVDNITLEVYDNDNIPKVSANILNVVSQPDNTIKLDLSQYLEDFEGYVYIRPKKNYVLNLSDIEFKGTIYTYCPKNGLIVVNLSESIDIDKYINNNELFYVNIPLVTNDVLQEFNNVIKYNDLEETIDKLDRELSWLSILIPKELHESVQDCEIIDEESGLFLNLNLSDLIALGHSRDCSTLVRVETIHLFEGKINELYLPFDIPKYQTYYWNRGFKKRELYIRSVLIKDFLYQIPTIASIFDIETIVVNIQSRQFIPDISRNNFDKETGEGISYLIGKAIHLGALENLDLKEEEKLTFTKFIDYYYKDVSEFESKSNQKR